MNQHAKATASIALVTAAVMPKPDPEISTLRLHLNNAGFQVAVVAWDSDIDWNEFDLILIKSTWDYFRRLPEFLSWVAKASSLGKLQNAGAVIAWNADKRYMSDLAKAKIPIIPTSFITPNSSESSIKSMLKIFGSNEIVIKPAVSIGAFGTLRINASDPLAVAHIREIEKDGHVLIQPFVPSVLHDGEVSLIYFGGLFSHAVRKRPASGEYRVQDHHGGTVHSHRPTTDEFSVAESALAVSPEPTLSARVDLVSIDGRPHVIELELIEPALFLAEDVGATPRLIDAINARLAA